MFYAIHAKFVHLCCFLKLVHMTYIMFFRFYGNVRVNKVTGNFHVIAGKSLPLQGGHAHLSFVGNHLRYNFSHRINHLSFGDMKVGFINVLDGDEFVTSESGLSYSKT